VWTDATCPDGTAAGDCATHLTPLAAAPGADTGAAPAPGGSQPADTSVTVAAPPPVTRPPAPPARPSTPAAPPGDGPAAPAVFNNPVHGTYRCSARGVLVNGEGSVLHLTGPCTTVIVNGAASQVEIDHATRILVNGAGAHVIYHSTATVFVNGAGATARRS
jgi:hypothetical protein